MPPSAWIASLPSTSASLPYWTAATRRCTPCPLTARTASRRPAVHQSRLGHHQQNSQEKHRQLTGSLIQSGRPAPLIGHQARSTLAARRPIGQRQTTAAGGGRPAGRNTRRRRAASPVAGALPPWTPPGSTACPPNRTKPTRLTHLTTDH